MTVQTYIALGAHEWSKLFSLREQLREFSDDLWDDATEKKLSADLQFLDMITTLEESIDKLDVVLKNHAGI